MKKILNLAFLAILILIVFQAFTTTYKPCDTPILYKIGSIDPKFGLTYSEVLANSREAASILSEAYGKELFTFSDLGEVTINFTFDERSELNSEINEQIGKVDEENVTLKEKIKSYQEAGSLFEKKLAQHNQTVQTYNSQGGAPPDIYEELINEQNELRLEADKLNRLADELNLDTKNYNLQVDQLNEDVTDLNQALIQKPEEGIYDPLNNTITIFFVNNKPELVHTIAHELGHARGMSHVTGEKSLMYPMSSKFTEFTNEDLEELRQACEEIPTYVYWTVILVERLKTISAPLNEN